MHLSIIVPTRNEGDNVEALVARIHAGAFDIEHEIVFVDDSDDGDPTPAVLEALTRRDPAVLFEHRQGLRGLGSAVARGLELAGGDVVVVMDADLQHPPELVRVLASYVDGGADVAVASRFIPGGSPEALDPVRRLISAGARWAARLALRRVRPIADPTSGFFAVRRAAVGSADLAGASWKVLIEVLARGDCRTVLEVPYGFAARIAGRSKMGWREAGGFLRHLFRLVACSRQDRRLLLFALVGSLGVGVNLTVYAALLHLGVSVDAAGASSAVVAMASNFILNDEITWRDARQGPRVRRAARFFGACLGGLVLDVATLAAVHGALGVGVLPSDLLAIGVAVAWNFTANDRWTWGVRPEGTVRVSRVASVPVGAAAGVPGPATHAATFAPHRAEPPEITPAG